MRFFENPNEKYFSFCELERDLFKKILYKIKSTKLKN